MKVGLISDTHCVFGKELYDFLKDVDVIWHCGDFGNINTLLEIAAFKPLLGVYGNCDDYDIRGEVPEYRTFNAEGKRVLMIHIGGYPGHYSYKSYELIKQYRPDIFVCGHSHILRVMNDKNILGGDDRMLVMNPGACGLMGFHPVRTALRFSIENGEVKNLELGQWARETGDKVGKL
ncbi:MAG: metallophosphoesterase family protein [Candidatus Egerieousia sp.]